ncbi:MAG: hypothetical protein H0X73_06590 [Chthoniobacterales bacterium]|nr:hypothetical protein [Chthoniobacterales bacterium]
MTAPDYAEIGRFLWQNYVPTSGQADTVQGELLRAAEKLRDESQRNGNVNWDERHEILARFILHTLQSSDDVPAEAKGHLERDIARIRDHKHPYTEDDLFDRVEKVIFDWYLQNKDPILKPKDRDLHR